MIVKNENDRNRVSQLMELIHVRRNIWIFHNSPTITDILEDYPRYIDCVELVSFNLRFYKLTFILNYIVITFKITEDFSRWFSSADCDCLLKKWKSIEKGIIKFIENSNKLNIVKLAEEYNGLTNEDGKILNF